MWKLSEKKSILMIISSTMDTAVDREAHLQVWNHLTMLYFNLQRQKWQAIYLHKTVQKQIKLCKVFHK